MRRREFILGVGEISLLAALPARWGAASRAALPHRAADQRAARHYIQGR
jgi:hypothetical protein